MRRRIVSERLLVVLVAVASLALPSAARAQAVYGSIAGTVQDSTGAALPGVSVTITSVERKTADTVVSNGSGLYTKDRLVPGTYTVKAELSGFRPALVSSVRVSVDTQTKVDVRLDVGQLTEAVEVTATQGQLLKTDRADVATTFESREITDLPVIDRNFTKFILLTPGTQQQSWGHAASENPQGSAQTVVNGQTFSGTGYQLDGTDNRDPILGIIVINPNLEAIGETKITSQNYDAEFGQAIAGVVSVQTKSGTNDFHGSAFEFLQRDRFRARNPFSEPDVANPITGRVIPQTKRDEFGGSIGGPIVKNEWFFFADYDGTRSNVGGSKVLTVPTAAARNGDLSAYGVNIFDPSGGAPGSRQQFGGNIIPNSRLSPQARAILSLIPLPNTAGAANGTRDNYIAQGSEAFNNDRADVKLDGRLSPSLNTFVRYSYARYDLAGPQAFGAGGGAELVSLGGNSKVRNQSLATGMDYTINAKTVLDARFGFFKYGVDVLPNDFGTTPATTAGIPGLNTSDPFTSGLPFFELNGGASQMRFGSGLDAGRCNCPLAEHEKQFQFVSNLTRLAGNHTVKFGVDIRRATNLRVPSDSHRSGQLYFNEQNTAGPDGGGLGLASFLLGNVQRFVRYTSTSTEAEEEQWRQFIYLQDTWRATSKLTLNYGIRADIINPQTVNAAGNGGWLDLSTGMIQVGGVGDVNLAGNIKNKINWAPRLGAAYQLNDKTVVRAGFGRSYDIGVFGSTFGHVVTQNLPVLSFQDLEPPSTFQSVFNLAQGPSAPVFVTSTTGHFALPNGVSARALPTTQHLSHVDAFNVTLQRELSQTLSAEIAYVGNRGHGFIGDNPAANVNQASIVGFGTLSQDQRKPFFNCGVRTADGLCGNYGWTQGVDFFSNTGKSAYNAFQAKLTKRFSHGISLLTHYTYQSHKNNDGDYFFIDPNVNYGPANFIRKQVFVLAGTADLPIGKGRMINLGDGVADRILGGWQVNANVTVQSGIPFNVSYRDAGSDRDTGPSRPNLIGDPQAGSGNGLTTPYFNVTPIGSAGSAFGRPAKGTFGDLSRNALVGPGYWNVDASLFKKFRLKAESYVELRLEAQNVFNHVDLDNPDAEIGVPGNLNSHAGFISGAAPNWNPRNLQFAVRFQF
jgi:Carboxypeptidase regulatory-like domain/TonB dependent receptor